MSSNYIIHKSKIYLLAGLLPMAACTDDFLQDNRVEVNTSESITFDASVALTSSSYSRSTTTSYEPLVLQAEDAADFPLYLHTYEHALGEKIEEMGAEMSRGVQVNTPKDLYEIHETFGIRGTYSNSGEDVIHMHETRLVSTDNYQYWAPVDPHRWPGTEKIQFTAIAPFSHVSKLKNIDYGKCRLSFSYEAEKSETGDKDAEVQADLVTAVADMARQETKDNNYRVPLTFHHALSAVKFAVRDVLKGKVISVTVKGIKSKGDCVYTADDNSLNGQFVWTNQSGSESYTQIFNHAVEDGYANASDPEKDVVLNEKMPEKTFMFIPQVLTEDAEIEVILEREGVSPAKIRMRGKILDNEVKEWKPGHEYVYTISTSKSNWTYVFEVNGSYRNNTEIYMPSPADEEIYKTFTDGGGSQRPYYEVLSYRFRTNNPDVKEALPWKASHGDGVQYYYTVHYKTFAEKDKILYLNRDREASERDAVPANKWLTDIEDTPFSGKGGWDKNNKEKHRLSFLSPIVTTDWNGDIAMYHKEPYSGNSEENPWDLSTFGGNTSRNTANCYVVDREGWYAIPLYYGNAIKNGAPNPNSWRVADHSVLPDRSKTASGVTYNYYALWEFKEHNGNGINTATGGTGKIPASYYKSAHLLWQDTYNVVENVKLATVKGEQMIVFHVNKDNLQQGNAMIGLSEHAQNMFSANTDDPKIVWSWHIWFNEHWLNEQGVSNAFSSTGFDTGFNSVSDMQQQGDLLVTVPRTATNNRTFYVSPYNVGWCDAKNVRYLSRYNTMDFVQYKTADGDEPSGKTAQLPIIQDGRTIQYRIGNNVYFQFGRKDPFVGFIDNESELKPRYGRLNYKLKEQTRSIPYSIKNPHELFVGGSPDGYINNDWNKEDNWNNTGTLLTEFYNLWNNTAYNKTVTTNARQLTDTEFFTSLKTIYDPSPAGYMVPPTGFFKILFKTEPANYNLNGATVKPADLTTVLNGTKYDKLTDHPIYRIYTSRGSTTAFFSLTGTGHRWYANSSVGAGNNFNPQIVYLWSSNVTKSTNDRSGYSVALGLAGDNYIVSAAFNGRKSMARPVRCVRE